MHATLCQLEITDLHIRSGKSHTSAVLGIGYVPELILVPSPLTHLAQPLSLYLADDDDNDDAQRNIESSCRC
jgi:hypothetical protein